MSVTRGMDYLRPFLPGLESVLEDEDVSEIMIIRGRRPRSGQ